MKKLTLILDPEVIIEAKRLANEQRTTVASMFANFIKYFARRHDDSVRLGRITRKATGLVQLPRGKIERQIVQQSLLQKYDLK
jgi:hypothetical protein